MGLGVLALHSTRTAINRESEHVEVRDVDRLYGERGGTRTLDPMIKSHVLYRLSYALTRGAV